VRDDRSGAPPDGVAQLRLLRVEQAACARASARRLVAELWGLDL
jgi:hypothetical protein